MDVNDIVNWIWYVANKNQSGAISGDEINLAFKVVAIELFNVKAGLPESYKPGAPFPPQAYAITDKIIDDLSPYIYPDLPIQRNAQGFFPKPANYYAYSSLAFNYVVNSENCGDNPTSEVRFIKIVNDSEWRVRIPNTIIPPTLEYPIAKVTNKGFRVAPKQINNVLLTYLGAPVPPVFGYTVVNDEYVYNAATSTQPDFPQTLLPEFAMRVVRYLSINIRDPELEKAALERLAAGQ